MAKKKSKEIADLEKQVDDIEKKFIKYSLDVDKAFKHLLQAPAPIIPYGPNCGVKKKKKRG
jgi:hypothetical protein